MYAEGGRPSIPPERLLKSMLLMALYTVRSERQFCEQLDYNLLFRWFLDMDMVEPSFVPTVFIHNRDRLIIHDAAGEFLRTIVEQARKAKLMSADHFTVDGTLIESWASLKSFKKKGGDDEGPPDDPGNPTVDFHGENSNETHESTTDPDAKLARIAVECNDVFGRRWLREVVLDDGQCPSTERRSRADRSGRVRRHVAGQRAVCRAARTDAARGRRQTGPSERAVGPRCAPLLGTAPLRAGPVCRADRARHVKLTPPRAPTSGRSRMVVR
jgi:transposase